MRGNGRGRREVWGVVTLLTVLVLAGCGVAVNEDLVATVTPYPVRSPVSASPMAGSAEVAAELTIAAEAALAIGDLEEADRLLARSLDIYPSQARAYIARARLALARAGQVAGVYDAALEDLNRALAIDPTSLPAQLGRSAAYSTRATFAGDPEDWQRALTALDAVTDQEVPEVAIARAIALIGGGDLAAARDGLETVPELENPKDRVAFANAWALLALRMGDWEDARTRALEALAVDPQNLEAALSLIEAEIGVDNASAALVAADELLVRLPDEGRALYWRGRALMALDRPAEARQSLDRVSMVLDESPVYQARISQAMSNL